MDYTFDIDVHGIAGNPPTEHFFYDDTRYFSKLYVFFKSIGLVMYTMTLTRCDETNYYIVIISTMFASLLNSMRYEYKHFQRYRTTFSSFHEYNKWKAGLWPKSRLFFSLIEIGLKLGYIIKTFPPIFDFRNPCTTGQSMLNLHVMVIFGMYIILAVFSACILCNNSLRPFYIFFCCCCDEEIQTHPARAQINSLPIRIGVPLHMPSPVVLSTNQECCICMDNDSIQTWSSLPCGHLFHASCVSKWIITHHTCPVCRFDMRIIV